MLSADITGFTFHGEDVPVLHHLGIGVSGGTLTAVLGGSGSGKSTLGKLLGGWLRPGDAGVLNGRLALAGTVLDFRAGSGDPRIDPAAWSRRVAYVPQDAASMLSTVSATVAEELAFGLENRGTPRPEMLSEVHQTAGLAGLAGLLDRNPATLSGGELRRLALGCALITHPDVLVLDEPLASLDAAGAAQLRELVRGLTAAGTAVVLLSQRADTLAGSAGHWIVLDAGTVAAAGSPADVAASPQLAATGVVVEAGVDTAPGVGSAVRYVPALSDTLPVHYTQSRRAARDRAPLLEIENLAFSYPTGGLSAPEPLLAGLDLGVRAGETVAITGPNGAGKSTLLRHLNGLLRPAAGTVRVRGNNIAGVAPGMVAASVGLLFQHPRDQLFERTVLREVSFGLRRLVGAEQAAARAGEALAAVGLSGATGTHPAGLPSSQQRLLALATVLAREPAVLALDEPTVGLDRHGLDALQRAVVRAAARGAAVVMVTHDLGYARANADRVLELKGGRLSEL
ncbi:ABC transporter ATP-binding protein [Arthrobacter sp. UYCu712]|uniref:ABC transporter ATP-binding protein n=1 Tax=Arthrobacter sp. UYCu712 TaxID=3156340 RepID=UPI00339B179F